MGNTIIYFSIGCILYIILVSWLSYRCRGIEYRNSGSDEDNCYTETV